MKTNSFLTLAGLTLALAGCKDAGETEKSQIEVLETGTGKKHSLELSFAVGSVQAVGLSMDMSLEVPGKLSVKTQIELGYEVEVVKVENRDDRRVAHVEYTFTHVDLQMTPTNPQVEKLLTEFKKLEGKGLLASVDQKGRQGYFKPASDDVYPIFASLNIDPDQIEQMFRDVYPEIPAQSMGVGASWRIEKNTHQGQNELRMKTTYKLVDAKELPDGHTEITLESSGQASVHGSGAKGGGPVSGRLVFIPAQARCTSGRADTDIKMEAGGHTAHLKVALKFAEKEFRGL